MSPATDLGSHSPAPLPDDDLDLCVRVLAEFREMPGLRLTLTQASRLFAIEPDRCRRVLGSLVDTGCLSKDGHAFAAVNCGRWSAW
jgi:hypothetical protein